MKVIITTPETFSAWGVLLPDGTLAKARYHKNIPEWYTCRERAEYHQRKETGSRVVRLRVTVEVER